MHTNNSTNNKLCCPSPDIWQNLTDKITNHYTKQSAKTNQHSIPNLAHICLRNWNSHSPIRHPPRNNRTKCSNRLNKIPTLSPIIQCLPNEWHKNKPPTIFPPIPTNDNSKTCNPKTTSLLKLAKWQNPKCEKITTDIIPWAKSTSKLGDKIKILHLTCPKDKRKEVAKNHAISVRTHTNEQTLMTIYTDGSVRATLLF
jgi:hypothetical protein